MFPVERAFSSSVLQLLSEDEGQRLDFKSKRIAPSKLAKTLVAFANSDGGEVYIGIEDDKRWDGFGKIEDANQIADLISQIFPLGDFARGVFITCDGYSGYVLKIEVSRTQDIKRDPSGDVYIRFSAQNLVKRDDASLRQLQFSKGVFSYEDQRIAASLSDIENSSAVLNFALNIVPVVEPHDWLRKQKLVVDDQATVAGLVLFADEPQVALPKSGVKLYRYRTTAQDGTRDSLAFDPITIEGNAATLIALSVEATIEKTQDIPKLGSAGLEKILYPKEAIHEVVTNAIIHRDYSVNDEVHVRIFDNRIEVFSPGKLPGYVTTSNILKERFARNPKIVRILNKFPNAPNKDIGEGLNTTFEKMRALKLRDPRITETDSGVTVALYHELLASPEELILEYLKANPEINNAKAREICREGSENKVKRFFEKMMESNIIERIPDRRGRATAYRLKNRAPRS
jgi:ATP-dependent DNA helicase RecG